MRKSLELLHYLIVPELERSAISPEHAPALIGQIELIHKETLGQIIDILSSESIQQLIECGMLTIGMIKPEIDAAILPEKFEQLDDITDSAIATQILHEIKNPLEVVFDISLTTDDEFIEQFYSGAPRETQLRIPPTDPNRYGLELQNRWEEHVAMMKRGPVTWMLLHDPNGNAVVEWRRQMGESWDVEKLRIEESSALRARWAKDNHNNLLHGSDSIESVHRELKLLVSFLQKILDNAEQ